MTSQNNIIKEDFITISKKQYNWKIRFDYYWKIALIIILTLSICYMFYEWKNINKETMACKNAPFVWGVEKAKEQGISCYYHCTSNALERLSNMTWGNS